MLFKPLKFKKKKSEYEATFKIANLMDVSIIIGSYHPRGGDGKFMSMFKPRVWRVSFESNNGYKCFVSNGNEPTNSRTRFGFNSYQEAEQYAQAEYQSMLNRIIKPMLEDINVLKFN